MGYFPSGNQMETHADWHSPAARKHTVDPLVHSHMEAVMDELKWERLTEVQGRLEAELLKTYFSAYGIDIELFQESVGQHAYPVTIDGLGRVQLFVSKQQVKEARQLLDEYYHPKE
jgi:hypothetical protein